MSWVKQFVRNHPFVWTLCLATVMAYAWPSGGWAMLAPARSNVSTPVARRQADLQKVQKLLESKLVRARLHAMGLNDHEIDSRVTQLSDAELHQVAQRIDKMHAAGADPVGFLIGVLVVGILVLLFIYLAKRV